MPACRLASSSCSLNLCTSSCKLPAHLAAQVWSRDAGFQLQTTEHGTAKAMTHDPLVVLVDGMSASASEIVSGMCWGEHVAFISGFTPAHLSMNNLACPS